MKLFRVEHVGTMDGMWTEKFTDGKLVLEFLSDDRLAKMPMPYDPTFKTDGRLLKTAVSTMEKMSYWFSKQDVQEMMKFGFRMMSFDCDFVIEQEHQVLFDFDERTNVVDVTDEFLNSVK